MPYWGGCYYWDGNYYYWGGYRYSSTFDRFDLDPFLYRRFDYVERPNANSVPIFFPPSPPPIGAPMPPKKQPILRTSAPADLAGYVYEPFYAPLSTRLSEQDLTKKLMSRLESYRTKRGILRVELQQKLDSTKDISAAERVQQLENFAHEQTPRLIELENSAEQLRSDLLRGGLVGLFSGTGNWNDTRGWRLDGNMTTGIREKTLVYEFLIMRAAVFYQEGLSPAQRRLLREVAMELQVEAFKPTGKEEAKPDEALLFFSPETARIHIPDDPPADLSAKITLYQNEKARLKTELRDTLYQYDNAPDSKRVQALKQLAAEQAASIASLDVLADDIRTGLAALPKPPGPTTAPAFPPELAARISAYHKEKYVLQKLLQSKLDEIRKRFAPESINLSPKSTNLDSQTYQLDSAARISEEAMKQIREAVAQLNLQNAQRFADLNKEKEAIRSDVANFAASHRIADGEQSVQSLIRVFLTALREEESWQPYQDYRTVVYQSGLSPEQRRLLFEIALEKLALPLPEGEF